MASAAPPADRSEPADGPGAFGYAKQAFSTFRSHQMTDRAASLTYFTMLSLFPAALVIVSLVTLIGQKSLATNAADYVLRQGADHTTANAVRNALEKMQATSAGAAGASLVISVLLALNGASGAFGAAGRALNVVHGVEEDRGFVARKVNDIGWTLAVVVLFAITLVALFLGGHIADDLCGTIGLGDAGAAVWRVGRWPLALFAAMFAFELVYAKGPDVDRPLRRPTAGSATAVVIWIVASGAFSVYVAHFSSYGAAYGAMGAAIVLLLWLYLSANAFLFGAELDKTIERAHTAGRGGPPFLTPPPQDAASLRRAARADDASTPASPVAPQRVRDPDS